MNKKILCFILLTYITTLTITFASPSPELVGDGAILMDATSGEILYAKNPHHMFYPASTTKVLTTALLVDLFDADATITKSLDSVTVVPADSSHIGLYVNDTYSYEDGLYAIMLSSDNFVSHDMAIHASGSIQQFSSLMNLVAHSAGAFNTHFTNPHGYHDPDHYTTPLDLAHLTRLAFNDPRVVAIAGTPWYEFTIINSDTLVPLKHTVPFFHAESPYFNPHVVAAKTGYHTPAGRTLVAKAEYENISLIAVVMHSTRPDYFEDVNKLLTYGAENFVGSVSETGDYTLENKSYSSWAKNAIEHSIAKGYYVQNLKSYMDPIAIDTFYGLLNKRFDLHILETAQPSVLLTPETAQTILSRIALFKGYVLPSQFVDSILTQVLEMLPSQLNTEQSLLLLESLALYFFDSYPLREIADTFYSTSL